jgi:hypothetical protein
MYPVRIAKCLNGRDKGRLQIIIGIDEEHAILVDGKSRKLSNPKRKKLKHIQTLQRIEYGAALDICGDYVGTDREIRKVLAVIKSAMPD